ncbi:MAG: M23 family metallopeptidase [Ammonifex sp.]|jgi:murein DD-endopeptidase MepM/ murein hydrolase activator NlpD|nr:MAG: M23 family metallopeptidase [Ammonifex sp.]
MMQRLIKRTTLLIVILLLTSGTANLAHAGVDEQLFGEPEPAVAEIEGLPTYYQVGHGDTLYGIARLYGVGMETIAQANGLSQYDLIYEGQYLVVPFGGLTHRVVAGDTLWNIAVRYGTALEEILSANGIQADEVLTVGADVIVPVPLPGRVEISERRERGTFYWPVLGSISSPFGMRDGRPHEGLDIAADTGTPVRAAADGTVIYAGPAGTYGLLVILKHSGDSATYYAHCDSVNVSVGQNVTAGEVVATVGSTGHSTGPHLHFEIRLNGIPNDPAAFLP